MQNAQLQQQIEQQNLALQKQVFGTINPYGSGLLGIGNNALKGIAPDYFQLGTRNAIANAFGGERQNLADFLGKTGQGFSGIAAGPAANLGAQEATAIGQAQADALNQALGLGLQGGNLLTGQQSVFNPTQYGGLATQGLNNYTQATPTSGFWSNLGGSLLGAGLKAGVSMIPGVGPAAAGFLGGK